MTLKRINCSFLLLLLLLLYMCRYALYVLIFIHIAYLYEYSYVVRMCACVGIFIYLPYLSFPQFYTFYIYIYIVRVQVYDKQFTNKRILFLYVCKMDNHIRYEYIHIFIREPVQVCRAKSQELKLIIIKNPTNIIFCDILLLSYKFIYKYLR